LKAAGERRMRPVGNRNARVNPALAGDARGAPRFRKRLSVTPVRSALGLRTGYAAHALLHAIEADFGFRFSIDALRVCVELRTGVLGDGGLGLYLLRVEFWVLGRGRLDRGK